MSLTATALKLVDLGSYPSMLVYYERRERKWFKRPRTVPSVLWPPERLPAATLTAQLLEGQLGNEAQEDIRADHWFEHPLAQRYYLRESCFRTAEDSSVTILWWEDEKQIIDIEEEEERKAARRSDEDWRRS
jgi:hypothetical protein